MDLKLKNILPMFMSFLLVSTSNAQSGVYDVTSTNYGGKANSDIRSKISKISRYFYRNFRVFGLSIFFWTTDISDIIDILDLAKSLMYLTMQCIKCKILY
ncbi:hypothetical protein ACFX19_046398 [Malus domestica]